MTSPSYSLSILAGPADAPFLRNVVQHLDRTHRGCSGSRVLVIDTLTNGRGRPLPGTDDLAAVAHELRADGFIDRVLELEPRGPLRDVIDRKHFGRSVKWDRDFRGVPLRGWVAGLESSTAPYHVHFDCDILLHQSPSYCWVREGIRLLELVPELLVVAPHPGPPTEDGLIQQSGDYAVDDRGFFRFETFSSRRFLTARARFERLLPLAPVPASRRHLLRGWLGLSSPVTNWELMVQAAMRPRGMVRAHLTDHRAWSLHAPDHGERFQATLPDIIRRVEAGDFPGSQAGRYDLDLACWTAPATGGPQITPTTH